METKIQLALLPTDYILWLLFFIFIAAIFYIRRHEHLRTPWRRVFHSKVAKVCAVILALYGTVTLLDSIHLHIEKFNQQGIQQYSKTKSVFDLIVSPLGEQQERTYSAPMAKTAYVSEANHYAPLKHWHLLGTDKIGQDVFYETLKSIRTGMMIGILSTIFMLPFALILGTLAGYFQGWVDDVIQYIYTTLSSIPGVLLISASILVLQVYISNHPQLFPSLLQRADARLLALCLILGLTSWSSLARLLRGESLKLREMEYIQAARSLGVSHWRIVVRHIMPNLMHVVLITVVLDFSTLVLAEAVLSYVGVGVDPTTPSWGNMINASRLELAREPIVWWPLVAALIFMFVLVLSANLFADQVRDAFDPKLKLNENTQ